MSDFVTAEKEDLWGKDFLRYSKEIFALGNTLMVFAALIMLFSSPLTIFGWSVPVLQGAAFSFFVAGLGLMLKTFWALRVNEREKERENERAV